MNEKEFGELIKRYLSDQATEEEVSLIEKWLGDRARKNVFDKLAPIERERIRRKNLKALSSRIAMSSSSVDKAKSGVKATPFYRLAAAIILLSVLSYSILRFTRSSPANEIAILQTTSTEGVIKKVILSDSSIIWLKGNSTVLHPAEFEGGDRVVKLTGEALFEVAKDPDHPFIIECGGLTAKVLGTSFNISSSQNEVEVLVLTGKVALSSKGKDRIILHPNEKAVYNEMRNHIAKVIAKADERTVKIKGTQYSMRFKATPMRDIIHSIERKFDVRISLSNPRLNNCSITADFTDQSLDRTLSMIAQTLEIEFTIRKNQVTLKGAGCEEI